MTSDPAREAVCSSNPFQAVFDVSPNMPFYSWPGWPPGLCGPGGLPDDPGDVAIVRSTLAMVHALGKEVLAEGVETQAQLDFLREAGCDLVQGYLLGRPGPPE